MKPQDHGCDNDSTLLLDAEAAVDLRMAALARIGGGSCPSDLTEGILRALTSRTSDQPVLVSEAAYQLGRLTFLMGKDVNLGARDIREADLEAYLDGWFTERQART
jgi:hypothetical protein